MKKTVAALVVCLVLLGAILPSAAWARGPWHAGHHRGCCHGGWFWPGAVIGGLALGAVAAATYPIWAYSAVPTYPPVAYVPAPVYVPPVTYAPPAYAPPAYAQPPVIYQQAPSYAAAQVQREVVYPHGRYVLYGDGVTQAWQWVWVPAAPPAPPAAPPPPQP